MSLRALLAGNSLPNFPYQTLALLNPAEYTPRLTQGAEGEGAVTETKGASHAVLEGQAQGDSDARRLTETGLLGTLAIGWIHWVGRGTEGHVSVDDEAGPEEDNDIALWGSHSKV